MNLLISKARSIPQAGSRSTSPVSSRAIGFAQLVMSTVRSCQCEPLYPLSGRSEHSRTRSSPPLGAHEQHSPPPPAPPRCHGRRCSCLSRLRAMLSSHSHPPLSDPPPRAPTLSGHVPTPPRLVRILLPCALVVLPPASPHPRHRRYGPRARPPRLPPALLRESFLVPFLRSLSPRSALHLLD